MATYERYAGRHVAERVRVAPGSDEDKALAADPAWVCVDAPQPTTADPMDRPPLSANKPEWVAYLVAVRGDDQAEAEAMSKAELIAAAAEAENATAEPEED
ncbi:hypothetical protein [Stackebrandtia soli]|uniref:hypothetical protein n=1 Tax=Stackebrandtia soli TaxID=1892856 RepID=UPI0039E9230A